MSLLKYIKVPEEKNNLGYIEKRNDIDLTIDDKIL
jgi:hypothetical protein